MEYLVRTLNRPQSERKQGQPERASLGQLVKAVVGLYSFYLWGNIAFYRRNHAKKRALVRKFYGGAFPVLLLVWVAKPLDDYVWSKLSGQVEFWQESIYSQENPRLKVEKELLNEVVH